MTHLIIAGHGRQRNNAFDPGAIGLIKKGEHKYVVEDLFPAMKKHLPKGHKVVFFSDHKVSNYGDLASLVKRYNAKEVTEIHYDSAGPTARGGHVIIHKNFTPDKVDLALRDAIDNVVGVFHGYNHKGYKGISGRDNLLNVNIAARNKISYRLIELGFGSNKTDADILVNQVDQYARELVKAITGQVNSKPVEKPKAPTKPKAPDKPVTQSKPKQNTSKGSGRVVETLVVDGERGKKTIRRWQQFLGTPVDGVISKPTSTMIKAWQQFLNKYAGANLVVDGIEGPATIRAGQRFFGTPVDGKISRVSPFIKELQRFLNTYGR